MPFVCDMTNPELLEDGSDVIPPRAEHFVYLPAPEYHPVRPPVTFAVSPPDFDQPEPMPPFPGPAPSGGRRIADLIRGQQPSAAPSEQQRAWAEESRRRSKLRQEWFTRKLFSTLVPALKAIGVHRVYCRYDGGNDEGFAWLDHYSAEDGTPLDAEAVGRQLHQMAVADALFAAGLLHRNERTTDAEWLQRHFGSSLSSEWASILLGQSFGTGEYLMYGAFTVDLDTCTIADDPKADPVVENIEIAD